MKKLGIVVGALLVLLIAIAVIVPLVVDVDKYRPQIVEAANKQINGKLELGKLSLSLWGQIRIEVAGLSLQDVNHHEIVGVKDAYFHIPFLSILSGSPVLTFKMKAPVVNVLKNKAGKLNVMSLMKETPQKAEAKASTAPSPSSQKPQPGAPSAPSEPAKPSSLPGIATRARLGIELAHASLVYRDETTGLVSKIQDLNLILQDISLSRPMKLQLWADLDTQMGKTFQLKGPAILNGEVTPYLADGKIDHISLTSKLDLDSLEMAAPGTFEKKKGMAMNADLAMTASQKEVKVSQLTFKFFNAQVDAQAEVTHLDVESGPQAKLIQFKMKSNEIQFKPWVELVPMLKEYELGGSAHLEADAHGPLEKLGYHAKFAFANLTAKAPQLKTQPRFDGVMDISTDRLDQFLVTMKAPANDLKIQGKVISFTKPHAEFQITSSGMDLDQLIEFPPPAAKKAKGETAATQTTTSTGTTSETHPGSKKTTAQKEDFDAMLAPVRENKMLADMVALINVDIKMIKAYQVKITDILCKMSFKDLVAGIDSFGMKVFSGKIQANAHLQLKPKTPTYQFSTQVSGFNLSQAVQSQFELFKNTITGTAFFDMTGQGSSFNPDPAISNLKAKGKMKVDQAAFATIDVMKMVAEALSKSLDKIPAAKGKTLGNLPSHGSKYDFISSDFIISDGKFSAPHFVAKASAGQGIDLKGETLVGMKDYSLKTSWDVIDTYNLTHAKDISVEQNGVKVEHILSDGGAPVHFPIHAGCTIMAPCYSYTEVPEFLGKIALNNIGRAVGEKAKSEAKKKAQEMIQQVAPPALQEKLKGFFH